MEPTTARKVMVILSLCLIAIAILTVVGRDLPGTAWEAVMLILGAIDVLAGLFIGQKYWRCSRCGAPLPMGPYFFSVEHCHECGEMIW
jgi:hypothetical protein